MSETELASRPGYVPDDTGKPKPVAKDVEVSDLGSSADLGSTRLRQSIRRVSLPSASLIPSALLGSIPTEPKRVIKGSSTEETVAPSDSRQRRNSLSSGSIVPIAAAANRRRSSIVGSPSTFSSQPTLFQPLPPLVYNYEPNPARRAILEALEGSKKRSWRSSIDMPGTGASAPPSPATDSRGAGVVDAESPSTGALPVVVTDAPAQAPTKVELLAEFTLKRQEDKQRRLAELRKNREAKARLEQEKCAGMSDKAAAAVAAAKLPDADLDDEGAPIPGPCKRITRDIFHHNLTVFVMVIFTLYGLFGEDLHLIFFPKSTDPVFSGINLAAFAVFLIECIVLCFIQEGYFLRIYFWLDLLAALSMLGEVRGLTEAMFGTNFVMARAGHAARAGTKVGRFIRISRLVRLTRIGRLFRMTEQSKKVRKLPGLEDEEKSSAIYHQIADLTTQKVVMIVLVVIFMLPAIDMIKASSNSSTFDAVPNMMQQLEIINKANTSQMPAMRASFLDVVHETLYLSISNNVLYSVDTDEFRTAELVDMWIPEDVDRARATSVIILSQREEIRDDAKASMLTILGVTILLAIGAAVWTKDAKDIGSQVTKPLRQLCEEMAVLTTVGLERGNLASNQEEEEMQRSRIFEVATIQHSFLKMKGAILSLAKYLPLGLAKELLDKGETSVGFTCRRVTVYLSDLDGFQEMVADQPPTVALELLSNYFEQATLSVIGQRGIIADFLGDALLAFWESPTPTTIGGGAENYEHARLAVEAALRVRSIGQELHATWLSTFPVLKDRAPFSVRVALHSGNAYVGNIGSNQRMKYGIMGDTVNLTSELSDVGRALRTTVLVTAQTYSRIRGMYVIRPVHVLSSRLDSKGKGMRVYEILERSVAQLASDRERVACAKQISVHHSRAFEAFHRKQFADCIKHVDLALAAESSSSSMRVGGGVGAADNFQGPALVLKEQALARLRASGADVPTLAGPPLSIPFSPAALSPVSPVSYELDSSLHPIPHRPIFTFADSGPDAAGAAGAARTHTPTATLSLPTPTSSSSSSPVDSVLKKRRVLPFTTPATGTPATTGSTSDSGSPTPTTAASAATALIEMVPEADSRSSTPSFSTPNTSISGPIPAADLMGTGLSIPPPSSSSSAAAAAVAGPAASSTSLSEDLIKPRLVSSSSYSSLSTLAPSTLASAPASTLEGGGVSSCAATSTSMSAPTATASASTATASVSSFSSSAADERSRSASVSLSQTQPVLAPTARDEEEQQSQQVLTAPIPSSSPSLDSNSVVLSIGATPEKKTIESASASSDVAARVEYFERLASPGAVEQNRTSTTTSSSSSSSSQPPGLTRAGTVRFHFSPRTIRGHSNGADETR